jgi:hypothetical protein
MKRLLVIIPFVIIIAAIIILLIPNRSPIERTFDAAIEAANSHDYARFSRYVDTRGLIKSYLSLSSVSGDQSPGNIDELERQVQDYIETERLPDPDRFRRLISTRISGQKAEAQIALDLRRYAVVCTTSVYLYSRPDSGWQIQSIELDKVYREIRIAAYQQNNPLIRRTLQLQPLTPEAMVWAILYNGY